MEFAVELPAANTHTYVMCVLSWHGGVDVRRFAFVVGVCAALAAAASTASLALDEQKVQVPPPAADAPAAGVQDSTTQAVKPDAGTEIRIPGLGKLGTLPKMDFGLELLYGAAEGKPAQEPENQGLDSDQDLTIRGSVKHRF